MVSTFGVDGLTLLTLKLCNAHFQATDQMINSGFIVGYYETHLRAKKTSAVVGVVSELA